MRWLRKWWDIAFGPLDPDVETVLHDDTFGWLGEYR